MTQITLNLSYKCEPVWVKDEEPGIYVGLPNEYMNNKELVNLMNEVSDEYDRLFIDDSYEFTFVGFKDEESWNKFKDKVNRFLQLLKETVEPEYEVCTESWKLDCETGSLLDREE